jgi:hypothetical protein
MAATNVSDTDPHVWKYVSEGGASIVFSYAGPANPQFDGKVLRLRKTTLQDGPAAPDADGVDDPVVTFQQRVMERLIPPEHLPRLESVHTDQRWLDALAALRDADRPLERRQHDRIDVRRRKAVLATDLVGGQGLSIEIKVRATLVGFSLFVSQTWGDNAPAEMRFPSLLGPLIAGYAAGEGADLPVLHAQPSEDSDRPSRFGRVLPAGSLLGRRAPYRARGAQFMACLGRLSRLRQQSPRVLTREAC